MLQGETLYKIGIFQRCVIVYNPTIRLKGVSRCATQVDM